MTMRSSSYIQLYCQHWVRVELIFVEVCALIWNGVYAPYLPKHCAVPALPLLIPCRVLVTWHSTSGCVVPKVSLVSPLWARKASGVQNGLLSAAMTKRFFCGVGRRYSFHALLVSTSRLNEQFGEQM